MIHCSFYSDIPEVEMAVQTRDVGGGVVWKATFHFEMQRSQMGTPKWGAVLLRTCLSGSKV